jgi:hypothetical protein
MKYSAYEMKALLGDLIFKRVDMMMMLTEFV